MKTIHIYLAGTIKKGKEEEHELTWTEQHKELLQNQLSCSVVFLNPAYRSDDLSDQVSVFGRDLFQVFSSNLVLVDARERRGLGVGAEMMFAKMHRIPVVSWLPNDSHYNREEIHFLGQTVKSWIHPFVFNLSDYLAPSLEDAASWIEKELLPDNVHIKGPESLREAMSHYLETQLKQDVSMDTLVSAHDHFQQKVTVLNEFSFF